MNAKERLDRLEGDRRDGEAPKATEKRPRKYASRPSTLSAARIGTRSRCLKLPRRGTCSAPATAAL